MENSSRQAPDPLELLVARAETRGTSQSPQTWWDMSRWTNGSLMSIGYGVSMVMCGYGQSSVFNQFHLSLILSYD